MSVSNIPYKDIFNDANREVILKTLEHAARLGEGNTGSAIYLLFLTRSKSLGLPPDLLARYPETMTIVLEHQFRDLVVDRENKIVRVTLTFSNRPFTISIPFGDIIGMNDAGGAYDHGDGNVDSFPIVIRVDPDKDAAPSVSVTTETDGNVTRVTFGKKSS